VFHTTLVLPEVTSFPQQVGGTLCLVGRGGTQLVSNACGVTLVDGGLTAVHPALVGRGTVTFEYLGGHDQILFGVVPVHQLLTGAEM